MTTGVVLHIPGVESEPGDETEMLFEQVLAQALAEHEIQYDGLVRAERLEGHDGWEPYEACPNCGNEVLGETCRSHGTAYVDDDGIDRFDVTEEGQSLVVMCPDCDTVLKDSVVVES